MTSPTEGPMLNLEALDQYPTAYLQGVYKRIDAVLDRRKGAERMKAKMHKMAEKLGVKITIEGDGNFTSEPVKYRNHDNAAETWTGRGRQPKWLVEALKAGKKLDDFEVKAEPPLPLKPAHQAGGPDFKQPEPPKVHIPTK